MFKSLKRHSYDSKQYLRIVLPITLIFSPTFAAAQQASSTTFNYELRMTGSRYTPNQANRPNQAVLEVPATQTVYLDAHGQYEIETSTIYPGGIEFNFQIKGNREGNATIDKLLWRNGIEIERGNATIAAQTYADLLLLAPTQLWRQAKQVRSLSAPPETDSGFEFKAFEDTAGRPVSVTIRRKDQTILAARVANALYEYTPISDSHWSVKVTNNGALNARWEIDQSEVTPREISLDFGSNYQEKKPRGDLRLEKIAEGVMRINGAPSNYHSHFIVGAKGIVAFDAPAATAETAKARSLLEQEFGRKPFTHIVLSHTHRDHIAGITSYSSENTTVLTGTEGRTALERQFGKTLTSPIVEVSQHQIIDLGNRRIQIFAMPSEHASEMLIAYDETSGIVFQGDLFTLAEHGPVPVGFDVNQELFDFISRHNLKVKAIVGVHGRISTMDELVESLRKREKSSEK